MTPPRPALELPDTALLPRGLADLLPQIHSMAALKVLLASIWEAAQPGRTGTTLSLRELQRRTGLARHSVIEGTRELVDLGLVLHTPDGHRLNIVSGGAEVAPHVVADPHSTKLSEQQQHLLHNLIEEWFMTPKAALATVLHYDVDYIQRHIAQTRTAGARAKNPTGWLITSLRDDWRLPVQQHLPWYTGHEHLIIR